MFFVYNKDKIISVVIALSTVLVLFLFAATLKQNSLDNNVIQTSSGTSKMLPVYNVDTEENKIASEIWFKRPWGSNINIHIQAATTENKTAGIY